MTTPVRRRGPSCPTRFEESDRRRLREEAWRSRGGRCLLPYAKLILRRSEDRREDTNEITAWKLTHRMCLERALQTYVRGVDVRLGRDEESDAPFAPSR
jgi:hypothetical protein